MGRNLCAPIALLTFMIAARARARSLLLTLTGGRERVEITIFFFLSISTGKIATRRTYEVTIRRCRRVAKTESENAFNRQVEKKKSEIKGLPNVPIRSFTERNKKNKLRPPKSPRDYRYRYEYDSHFCWSTAYF